jgi:hypothetical protein
MVKIHPSRYHGYQDFPFEKQGARKETCPRSSGKQRHFETDLQTRSAKD